MSFGEAGQALWDGLNAPLESGEALIFRPDERPLVVELCHLVDDLAEIRETLAEVPLLAKGSMGQDRVHPLRDELHATSRRVESLVKTLRVPDEFPVSDSARELAERRWARSG